jgi:nitric oxide reductase large subunit
MSQQPASTSSSAIVWPSVITVISAAILIGAEVFGAAFAGGWALAILFGLDDTAAHILQAVLFGIGVLIMVAFKRAAQRIEPFFKRSLRTFKKTLRHRRKSTYASRQILTSVHVWWQRRALRTLS